MTKYTKELREALIKSLKDAIIQARRDLEYAFKQTVNKGTANK